MNSKNKVLMMSEQMDCALILYCYLRERLLEEGKQQSDDFLLDDDNQNFRSIRIFPTLLL